MSQDRIPSKSTISKLTPNSKPKFQKDVSHQIPVEELKKLSRSRMAEKAKFPLGIKPPLQDQRIPIDRLIQQISAIVFSNVKIYLEERLSFVDRLANGVEDIKFNIATLSSLLHTKSLFSQEEYENLYAEVVKSFGIVNLQGKMSGEVIITKYNFSSER